MVVGKTSSAMYPFTKQFLEYNSNSQNQKFSMLILDVKGNYGKQVKIFSEELAISSDIIIISLTSNIYYNPLHKPNLKAHVLANRLKTILLLFSEGVLAKKSALFTEKVRSFFNKSLLFFWDNGY